MLNLALPRKTKINKQTNKMKKNFSIKMLAVVAVLTVLSSCGSGRHKCPAYGSLDADSDFHSELAETK